MVLVALTFDLDDTLLDFAAAQREGLAMVRQEIIAALGLAPDALPVGEMMALRDRVTADWAGPWNLPAIRLVSLSG